jgi:hypothetical protein
VSRHHEAEDDAARQICARPELPPFASMIDRQTDSPRPKPPGLVVWKASKMRSSAAGATPGPVSRTATSAPAGSALEVLITKSRGPSLKSLIASIALMIRGARILRPISNRQTATRRPLPPLPRPRGTHARLFYPSCGMDHQLRPASLSTHNSLGSRLQSQNAALTRVPAVAKRPATRRRYVGKCE